MYGNEEKNCWEVEAALTPFVGFGGESAIKDEEKIFFCGNCTYYQHIKRISD